MNQSGTIIRPRDASASKKESIEKYICEQLKPDGINLEETMLRHKAEFNIRWYFSFSQNRPDGAGGGGIATLVSNALKQHATMVAGNNDKEEFIVVRFEHVKSALNVINIYGRVESRTSPDKILEDWTELLKELSWMEARQEAILLIGDWNRAVGDGKEGVEGSKTQVSYGGSLIRDLISTKNYFMLNNLKYARGGPWTRVCPSTGNQSCLDLAIGSSNLQPYVRMFMIDSDKKYAPRRAVKNRGALGVTYTYHYPILMVLEMPRTEETPKKPEASWNTLKTGGWEKYKELSNKMADKINAITENEDLEVEEVMTLVEKIQTKMKFSSFGKTKPQTESAKRAEMKIQGTESEEAKELLERQSKRMTKAFEEMRTAQGRVTKIFKMKNIVAGKKKVEQEAQAIKDPETGKLVVSISKIKEVTLNYCLKTL